MARCLHPQPSSGDLCHCTDLLLYHCVGAPARSLLLVETQVVTGMLCPHPVTAPLGRQLCHRFSLKHPHSAASATTRVAPRPGYLPCPGAHPCPILHGELDVLPKEPGPSWVTQSLGERAVPCVVMVWQEMSAGLATRSGLSHLDGRDVTYVGKQCREHGPGSLCTRTDPDLLSRASFGSSRTRG